MRLSNLAIAVTLGLSINWTIVLPGFSRDYQPPEEVPMWVVVAEEGLWCRDRGCDRIRVKTCKIAL